MKILRVIARLNVGGPARHVVWLTKSLQTDEFQTRLIAGTVPDGEEDMSYFALENRVEPIYIRELSRELSPKDLLSLFKIYRHIIREKPDIIHTHTAKAGTVGRTAAFLYRWLTWKTLVGKPRAVKVVHTFHGHVFHSYYGRLKTKIFLLVEKSLARFATDKIIVISQQQLREIRDDFGVGRGDQFAVIPLGIDLEDFSASEEKRSILRDEIGAGDDEIIIGFVGRLTHIKNISSLLNVASLYQKSFAGDTPRLKFVIIGDGDLRKALEKEVDERGIAGLFTFLGNRTDTAVLYPGMDAVALTSLNEGTPLSLIEAMACGRAVISTGVGGVIDLLGGVGEEIDGFKICERGICVDSFDAQSYLNGLIYLAKNEGFRKGLGKAGQDFVAKQYSKDRLVEDIKKLYRELM